MFLSRHLNYTVRTTRTLRPLFQQVLCGSEDAFLKIMGRMPTDDDDTETLVVGGVMRNMWVAVSGVPDAYVRSWSDSELQDLVAPMPTQFFAAGRADVPRRVHITRSNEIRKSVWKTEMPVVPDCVQLVNGVRDACGLESSTSLSAPSTPAALSFPAPGTPAAASARKLRSRPQKLSVCSIAGSADSWPPCVRMDPPEDMTLDAEWTAPKAFDPQTDAELATLLGYDMAVAQYISGSGMLGDFDADPEDADDGDDEPQSKKKKRGGTGEHPQVLANRDVTEKFEEKLRDVINWHDAETFKQATNYKSRPTYFMTKLQACEKLSRDVLNEKAVADKFAANVVVFEKYIKLAMYLKKNDMLKFKRTQEKCKSLVELVDDLVVDERIRQVLPLNLVSEYNKVKIETSLNAEADIDQALHAWALLAKFPSLHAHENDEKNKENASVCQMSILHCGLQNSLHMGIYMGDIEAKAGPTVKLLHGHICGENWFDEKDHALVIDLYLVCTASEDENHRPRHNLQDAVHRVQHGSELCCRLIRTHEQVGKPLLQRAVRALEVMAKAEAKEQTACECTVRLGSMMEYFNEHVLPLLNAEPFIDAAMHDPTSVGPVEKEFQRRRSLWWTTLEKLDVQHVSSPYQAEYLAAMDHAHALLVNQYNSAIATGLSQSGHASADTPRSSIQEQTSKAIQDINSKWNMVMPFAQSLRKLWEMEKAKSGKSMLLMSDNEFKVFFDMVYETYRSLNSFLDKIGVADSCAFQSPKHMGEFKAVLREKIPSEEVCRTAFAEVADKYARLLVAVPEAQGQKDALGKWLAKPVSLFLPYIRCWLDLAKDAVSDVVQTFEASLVSMSWSRLAVIAQTDWPTVTPELSTLVAHGRDKGWQSQAHTLALVVLPEKASLISQNAWLSDAKLEFGKCLHESAALTDPEALYNTLEHLCKADQFIGEARKLAANLHPDVEAGITKASQEMFDAVAARGFLSRLQQVTASHLNDLPQLKDQEKMLKAGTHKHIRGMFLKGGVVKKVASLKKLVAVHGQFKDVHFGSSKSKLFLNKWCEAKAVVDKAKTWDFVLRTVNLMLNTLPTCPNNVASRLYNTCVA